MQLRNHTEKISSKHLHNLKRKKSQTLLRFKIKLKQPAFIHLTKTQYYILSPLKIHIFQK